MGLFDNMTEDDARKLAALIRPFISDATVAGAAEAQRTMPKIEFRIGECIKYDVVRNEAYVQFPHDDRPMICESATYRPRPFERIVVMIVPPHGANVVGPLGGFMGAHLAVQQPTVQLADKDEDWTTATMQNSWVSYDTTVFYPAQYYKDRYGWVHLRGLVKNGTLNADLFTLPAGYRPTRRVVMSAFCDNLRMVLMIVNPSTGGVFAATGTATGTAYLSLDGICFPASPEWDDDRLWTPPQYMPNYGRTATYDSTTAAVTPSIAYNPFNGMSTWHTDVLGATAIGAIMVWPEKLRPWAGHIFAALSFNGATPSTTYSDVRIGGSETVFLNQSAGAISSGGMSMMRGVLLPDHQTERTKYTGLAYSNGWTDYSDGTAYQFARGAYYRDDSGTVWLKGLIKRGALTAPITSGQIIATLPPGYRPAALAGNTTRVLAGTISNGIAGRVDIFPNGTITAQDGNETWISLAGINFRAEG